jgi:hypothetical protein
MNWKGAFFWGLAVAAASDATAQIQNLLNGTPSPRTWEMGSDASVTRFIERFRKFNAVLTLFREQRPPSYIYRLTTERL